ncbi:hypothetical protein RKD18_000476 [Streptomyces phaeoluteigriseus]
MSPRKQGRDGAGKTWMRGGGVSGWACRLTRSGRRGRRGCAESIVIAWGVGERAGTGPGRAAERRARRPVPACHWSRDSGSSSSSSSSGSLTSLTAGGCGVARRHRSPARLAPAAVAARAMSPYGPRVPSAECRVPSAECRVPGAGCRVPGAGCRVPGAECRVPGAGCRVPSVECRVPGAGCRVSSAGCRVPGGRGVRGRPGSALCNPHQHRTAGPDRKKRPRQVAALVSTALGWLHACRNGAADLSNRSPPGGLMSYM